MKSITTFCSCLLLAILVQTALAQNPAALLRGMDIPGHAMDCIAKAQLSPADLPAIMKGEQGSDKIYCFAACVMQHAGVMNGKAIDAEKITEKLSAVVPSDGTAHVDKVKGCIDKANAAADECDAAKQFAICIVE